jgi:hypothetical protein
MQKHFGRFWRHAPKGTGLSRGPGPRFELGLRAPQAPVLPLHHLGQMRINCSLNIYKISFSVLNIVKPNFYFFEVKIAELREGI